MTAGYSAVPYETPSSVVALPLGLHSYAGMARRVFNRLPGLIALRYTAAALSSEFAIVNFPLHSTQGSFTMFYQLFRSPAAGGRRPRPVQRLRHLPRLEQLEDRCLLSANVVLEWNAIALDALKNDSMLGANNKQNAPTRASRALAIVQAAVFDAVNSIDGSFDPYLIKVRTDPRASVTAAAAQAAHDTLSALFPDFIPTLDADLAADLANIPSGRRRDEGVRVGKIVAAGMLAARSNDGADVSMPYTPGDQPGQWRPDPLHPNQKALGSLWGEVTPFALR